MARTLKTNGIYKIKCALTGHVSGTNPKVFTERAKMFGVDVAVLKTNYVCRTARKYLNRLVEAGKDPHAAVELIRENYGVKNTAALDETVMAHILEDVGRGSMTAAQKKEQEMKFAAGCKALDALIEKAKPGKKGAKTAPPAAPEADEAEEASNDKSDES